MEVHASALDIAVVSTTGSHPENTRVVPRVSKRYLAVVRKRSFRRATPSSVVLHAIKCVQAGLLPENCVPSQRQAERALQRTRRAEKFADCQFDGLERVQALHPESVIHASGLEVAEGKLVTPLRFIVCSKYSLKMGIEYSSILYMDSSSRNKSDLGAHLTTLVVQEKRGKSTRMTPVAAMISSDVSAETYQLFLTTVKIKVETSIAAETGLKTVWNPVVVVVDKDRAEINAIQKVWPTAQVRLCQFHVKQAIGRKWDAMQVSQHVKYTVQELFTRVQRAVSPEDLAIKKKTFMAALSSIIPKKSKEPAVKYFEDNWFSGDWPSMWADFGLIPSGQHRSDGSNTNNYSESGFKTFDGVILNRTCNRRLDVLAGKLILDYFPYYQLRQWTGRENKSMRGLIAAADELFYHRGKEFSQVGSFVKVPSSNGDKKYEIDLVTDRCTCPNFLGSGLRCKHVHAAKKFILANSTRGVEDSDVRVDEDAGVRGVEDSGVRGVEDSDASGDEKESDVSGDEEPAAVVFESQQPRTHSRKTVAITSSVSGSSAPPGRAKKPAPIRPMNQKRGRKPKRHGFDTVSGSPVKKVTRQVIRKTLSKATKEEISNEEKLCGNTLDLYMELLAAHFQFKCQSCVYNCKLDEFPYLPAEIRMGPKGYCQIHYYDKVPHWFASALINDTVYLMDSAPELAGWRSELVHQQLQHLYGGGRTVQVLNVQSQIGDKDCGLFALAFCHTVLKYGPEHLVKVDFSQYSMRSLLLKVFKSHEIEDFRSQPSRRKTLCREVFHI